MLIQQEIRFIHFVLHPEMELVVVVALSPFLRHFQSQKQAASSQSQSVSQCRLCSG